MLLMLLVQHARLALLILLLALLHVALLTFLLFALLLLLTLLVLHACLAFLILLLALLHVTLLTLLLLTLLVLHPRLLLTLILLLALVALAFLLQPIGVRPRTIDVVGYRRRAIRSHARLRRALVLRVSRVAFLARAIALGFLRSLTICISARRAIGSIPAAIRIDARIPLRPRIRLIPARGIVAILNSVQPIGDVAPII